MAVNTAVTDVVAPANPMAVNPVLAASANAAAYTTTPPEAPKSNRGRKPIVLKNGKTYKEAKDEASEKIREAKRRVQAAAQADRVASKDYNRIVKDAEKASAGLAKLQGEAVDKANREQHKQHLDAARLAVRDSNTARKDAEKVQKAAAKDLEAANKAYTKAQAELQKVEAMKLALKA